MTDNGADRTLRAMIGRRLAMLGGALWQVARLVLIMLLILRVLPEFIPYFHVNILWAGGSSLLLCGLFVISGFGDAPIRSHLSLMRLGVMLSLFSDAAVVITRSFQTLDERLELGNLRVTRLVFAVAFGIMVVDLLIFITLVSYRVTEHDRTWSPPRTRAYHERERSGRPSGGATGETGPDAAAEAESEAATAGAGLPEVEPTRLEDD